MIKIEIVSPSYLNSFWNYVHKGTEDGGCWLWDGHIRKNGYGQAYRHRTAPLNAHRLSYEIHHNELVPKGKHVHHKCKNRACVNPAHLIALTVLEHNRVDISIFSWDDVLKIRQQVKSGKVRGIDVAREYGLHKTTIYHLLSGKYQWTRPSDEYTAMSKS